VVVGYIKDLVVDCVRDCDNGKILWKDRKTRAPVQNSCEVPHGTMFVFSLCFLVPVVTYPGLPGIVSAPISSEKDMILGRRSLIGCTAAAITALRNNCKAVSPLLVFRPYDPCIHGIISNTHTHLMDTEDFEVGTLQTNLDAAFLGGPCIFLGEHYPSDQDLYPASSFTVREKIISTRYCIQGSECRI
jgi:hypothetical protein